MVPEGDGRIGGLGISLVAKEHVQIGEPARGIHQRGIHRRGQGWVGGIVGRVLNAQLLADLEDGLIDLDQAQVGGVRGERHIADPARAGQSQHADDGINLVLRVIGKTLVEQVDLAQDVADPARGQRVAVRPGAPARAARAVSEGLIAAAEEVVHQHVGSRSFDSGVHQSWAGGNIGPVVGIRLSRHRKCPLPFKVIVGGIATEIAAVLEGLPHIERVRRLNVFDITLVAGAADLD